MRGKQGETVPQVSKDRGKRDSLSNIYTQTLSETCPWREKERERDGGCIYVDMRGEKGNGKERRGLSGNQQKVAGSRRLVATKIERYAHDGVWKGEKKSRMKIMG